MKKLIVLPLAVAAALVLASCHAEPTVTLTPSQCLDGNRSAAVWKVTNNDPTTATIDHVSVAPASTPFLPFTSPVASGGSSFASAKPSNGFGGTVTVSFDMHWGSDVEHFDVPQTVDVCS